MLMDKDNRPHQSHVSGGEARSNPSLEMVLRGSPVTLFLQDRDLRYTWINNPAVGLTPEAFIGRTDDELFPADEAATLRSIKRDVLTTGRSRRSEVRINCEGHARYFDLTVEPRCDEAGQILGLTGAAIDITHRRAAEDRQRVLAHVAEALRTLDDPHELMRAAGDAVRSHLHVRHVIWGEVASDGRTLLVTHHDPLSRRRFDLADFGQHIVSTLEAGRPMVVHHAQSHTQLEPAVRDVLRGFKAVSFAAVPLLKAGRLVAVLVAHHSHPRYWNEADVALLEDVAQRTRQAVERARAERALRDSEERYRLLSGLTSDYAFSYRIADDGNHVVEWKSGAFQRITGFPEDLIHTAADWHKLIHPSDLPLLQRFVDRLLTNQAQSAELRIITKSGETRWLAFDAQPIWDHAQQRVARVVGAARDITQRKRAESEHQRLLARLKTERALIEEVIDQMPVAIVVAEAPSGKLMFVNAHVQQITGYAGPKTPESTWEESNLESCHADGSAMTPDQWPLMRALRDEQVVEAEEFLCRHVERGEWVTLRSSAAPVRDAAGRMVAAVSIFSDVTAEKRAEKATKLLARAGRILASSLDYETTLRSVAQLSVPDLADWCQLDIVTPQGDLQFLAGAHADVKRANLEHVNDRYPATADASWGPWAVTRSGEVEWAAAIRDDMLQEIARDAEHLRLLREVDPRSYISVPLKGRGRVLGVLTFLTEGTGSGRQYTQADVDLASELARRASMVIEKALLYRDAQRELAERRATERKLQSLNETLEQRVAERSAEAERRAAQLRTLAAELTQAEQRERRRLAQTLHDHLQQLLVAAKLRLHAVIGQFDDDAVTASLRQIDELMTQSVDVSRSLTIELSPPILHDAGLPAALEWLGRWMGDKHGLSVTVNADPAANPGSEDLRVFLFNAARELMFNVVKHAATRQAAVELTQDAQGRIRLVVSDQGVGFDSAIATKDRSGFGLFSLQQRLDVIGGEARLHSEPGRGTRIELIVPNGQAAANG